MRNTVDPWDTSNQRVVQTLATVAMATTGVIVRQNPLRLYLSFANGSASSNCVIAVDSAFTTGGFGGSLPVNGFFETWVEKTGQLTQLQWFARNTGFGVATMLVTEVIYVPARRVNGPEIEGLAPPSLGYNGTNDSRWRELKEKIADYKRLRPDSVHGLNRPAIGFNARHSGSHRRRAT